MAPAQGWHAKSWSVPHFLRPLGSILFKDCIIKSFFCFKGLKYGVFMLITHLKVRMLVRFSSDSILFLAHDEVTATSNKKWIILDLF